MNFSIAVLFISVVGIVLLVAKRWNDYLERCRLAEKKGEKIYFALFMRKSFLRLFVLWKEYLENRFFFLLERLLRRVRIVAMKIERVLFNATHRVRIASNRKSLK
jgi:hypothetical protein